MLTIIKITHFQEERDIAFTSYFCNNSSHPASPASLFLTSPHPCPTCPRVPYLISSSPSSRVPKTQVLTQASRCPRPLVPVPLLYIAVARTQFRGLLRPTHTRGFAPGACSRLILYTRGGSICSQSLFPQPVKYRGAFCGVKILVLRMKCTHEIVGTHKGNLLPEHAPGAKSLMCIGLQLPNFLIFRACPL